MAGPFLIEELLNNQNFNIVCEVAHHLVQPVNLIPHSRVIPVRNINYYEEVIPSYNFDDFWNHFRMSRRTFEILLNQLQHLRPNDVVETVAFEKKVLFSIWVVSKQESFLAAGDRFNLAKSTSHNTFFEIISLIASLRHEVIVWPNNNERERTARVLQNKSNIPGIIGAIDGCHIPIKAPSNNPIDFYNRNNFHSVILQGVCNDKKESLISMLAHQAGYMMHVCSAQAPYIIY